MIAYCLADVFNLRLWPRGRDLNYADVRDGLQELVSEAVAAVPSAREVTIRLYGGWHGDTPASMVDVPQMVDLAVSRSPRRLGTHRVRLQIADHPVWNPSIRMLQSVRDTAATRLRARLTPSPECALPTTCSVPMLASWVGGSCPERGCPVRLRDVARRHRQKMVDTLLTADALVISHHALADVVLLASDDHDMIPALLALVASPIRVVHLGRALGNASPLPRYYEDIIELAGATTRRW